MIFYWLISFVLFTIICILLKDIVLLFSIWIGFLIAFCIMLIGGTITTIILVGAFGAIVVWILGNIFRGPFLRVEHIKRQVEQLNPLVYRHIISVRNIGKISGDLKNLVVKSSNNVKQSLIMVDDIYTKKVAPICIKVGSTPIWLDCFPSKKDTNYCIEAEFERSILGFIYRKTKTIWGKEQ